MSDKSVEMYNVDKPTRFQVNRVNSDSKRDSKEVYRKINESDDEDAKNDTFPENGDIVIRRQSRTFSLKSSFRDKDKPSKYKDLQTTRFEDLPHDSDEEDRESLLDNDYDAKYGKSFRHFTREALPRMDNYRNMLSIQAACRPTLDELHNNTFPKRLQRTLSRNYDHEAGIDKGIDKGIVKFGWIQGVLIRCLLNIWGVMLFLRLSWVTGQSGIIEAIILILTTTAVTGITALSMSAISTNGVVKGGGAYYMISRSLGPEFGGSIGLIFSLANAVACAMYVVGFCESMNDLFKSLGFHIVDGGLQDIRIVGVITIIILTVIVVVGLDWEAKAQVGLLVILVAAIIDYLIGSIIGPKSDLELAKGFTGYSSKVFADNLYGDYRKTGPIENDFFSVFAIFFPAATGILAGANISGDLKDPQNSIPKGTLLAIFITTTTYILMVFVAGATVMRDATGNIEDVVNGTIIAMNCTDGCKFGLQNSFQVIELVSGFGPLIYAGCFAATLSSALASLVSAPKVFQALCKDELYPKIKWFAKGFGKNNEPVRGYVLTFILATGFILIAELNVIAPLISNFFLAAYMLINFSTFHASLVRPIGWRPRFKYYNMWLSLVGAILCVAVMFLISWGTALITFSAVIALYLIVAYRKPDVNWGSTTQAQTYKNALLFVQKLNNVSEHVKNYRPQILVLSGSPTTRPILVDFAYLLTKKVSLMVCGHVHKGSVTQKQRSIYQQRASEWFRKNGIKAFYTLIDGETFESGSNALLQASGIGKLKPNVLLMGFKSNWRTCERSELIEYFNTIHKAFDMHLAVAILRLEKGLDYSLILENSIIKEDEKTKPKDTAKESNGAQLPESNLAGQSQINSSSCDSLDKTISQASSASDLSTSYNVSNMPDPNESKPQHGIEKYFRKVKKPNRNSSLFYKARDSIDLSKSIQQELSLFTRKRADATIDVYWLYDDGGLTLLLPYIISTRNTWSTCKLRIFALTNKQEEIEFELSSMASLLAKFRIDYSDLQLISDITNKAQESTVQFFDNLIKDFMGTDNEDNCSVTESLILAAQDKTNRHLRLREYLLEHSKNSDLVVMTLPMPKKNIVTAPLYMAWLECLSRGLPPFLFVRGNQTSVLTFYS